MIKKNKQTNKKHLSIPKKKSQRIPESVILGRGQGLSPGFGRQDFYPMPESNTSRGYCYFVGSLVNGYTVQIFC